MWAIARLALGSVFLGGFGSAAYYSTALDIDIPEQINNEKPLKTEITEHQKKQFTTTEKNMSKITIQDVEMYEKYSGCRLVFTDKFGEKKNYTVRAWFNEKMKLDPTKKEEWRWKFADGLVFQKRHCKKGGMMILELQTSGAFTKKEVFNFQE